MTVSELMKKMIDASEGNLHDINHFVKVWGYAKTIGELEGIPSETQFILECAAIMHDIACPLCRRKYGNTNGTYQEKEGMPLGRALLADTDLTDAEKERIVFLIGHVFNLGINMLGAYVHTSRLQYVEFFGKFYEGGGTPFVPFDRETKFVEFKEEKQQWRKTL